MVDFKRASDELRKRQELLALPIKVAGTGHRPDKLGGYNAGRKDACFRLLFQDITTYLEDVKPGLVISGGALGFDQYLAAAAVELGIPLLLALPCLPFGDNWPPDSLGAKADKWLRGRAASVYFVSPGSYKLLGPKCMQWRNEWMVDNATHLLACWDGSDGGTGNCIRYAETKPELKYTRLWRDEYRG